MRLNEIEIRGRKCYTGTSCAEDASSCGNPDAGIRYLLVQAVDEHDMETLEHEVSLAEEKVRARFAFAAFRVNSWNDDLSPWEAPPVFGDEPFGRGAEDTLSYILDDFVPEIEKSFELDDSVRIIIGGYSLSAFFALWCMTRTDRFSGIASASPSVWFPGWTEHLRNWVNSENGSERRIVPVYLSLGNKEPKTRNPLMKTVGDSIEETRDILSGNGIPVTLEWNQGNHFREPDVRTAKGFAWVIEKCEEEV